VSCFHLPKGALGNENGSWVLIFVGLMREHHRLIGVSLQRGFARESLGEPPTSKLVANGSQQFPCLVGSQGHVQLLETLRNSKITKSFLKLYKNPRGQHLLKDFKFGKDTELKKQKFPSLLGWAQGA
jgi:hypothetical protein